MSKCPIVLNAVVALVLSVAASPAVAQNLVVNPNLDTDTSGWETSAFGWNMLDVDNSPMSGSTTYLSFGNPGARNIQQCITLDPMIVGYDFSAWAYVPSGQVPDGFAGAALTWYNDTMCTGIGSIFTEEFRPFGSFDVWEQMGGAVFTPPTALSVRVLAFNLKLEAGNFQVYFDAFTLEPNPSMIFGDSFENGTPAAWSGVVPGPS